MRRSAVGVMNGNFRGGMYYDYRKQVEAGERKEALLRVERMYMEECFQLEGDSFVAWYESDAVPQYGSIQSRIDLIKARIAEIQSQPHPVEQAYAVEKSIVVSAVPVKVTVSRSWAERHLNVDVNGFDAELDKAFGEGNWILA